MLIVIDVESNVSRIVELIEMLDTPAPDGVEQIVTLQQIIHNDVTEIHKTVSELFSNLVRNGKPTQFKLLIETRLNSLFIVANRDTTGEIIEFVDEEIENLQKKVAEKYGYTLVDHKLELYGIKKK